MPTIQDVANRAGVAPITVSRVINNSGYVSAETRTRVEAAIAELEYVPNILARSLRIKQTNTLALVLTDITNPFWTTVARGVEDAANVGGFNVILCNTDESEAKQSEYLNVLLQKQVDGILLVPARSTGKSVELIQKQGVPVVVLDRRVPHTQVDVVYGDSKGGAYRLVQHLLSLGHRRIAVLSGPQDVSTAVDRVAGYRQAMKEAGLGAGAELIYYGEFNEASGYELARQMLTSTPLPTALLAANNFIALGALRALREAGLRVPEDMSVVAFDDLISGFVIEPFLTVADQPAYEMGQRATELLLARLSEQASSEYRQVMLPTKIVVRRSSGPPSGRKTRPCKILCRPGKVTTVEETTVRLTEPLAKRLGAMAEAQGVELSDLTCFILARALERMDARPAIAQDRGQREGSREDPRLDWWREARFGMFIHWGLYAIPAGEWKGKRIPGIGEWIMKRAQISVAEYEQLAKQFNPVKFDAAEWVSLAVNAGQKYIVITSKHHDGFCLFKSEVGDYNIVDATPFGRDPLEELAAECQKQGIKLCFYHSQTQDWHHPNGDGNDWDYDEKTKDFAGYVENYVVPQVRELLTNYGPIGLIWFDTPKRMTAEQSRSLLDLVHEIQPDCLVSGRVGNVMGDYASAGDNRIPDTAVDIDWETPATINDTWGFKSYDHNWKSTEDLIRKLVDIVSKGGNYLLNVGPTAEGLIPQPSVERLLAMGEWLKINGEAVYGTRPGPIQGLDWCRSTAKPGQVYLHVFDWPEGGEIVVSGLEKVASATLLSDASRGALPVRYEGDDLIVQGPSGAPNEIDTVVVLGLEQ